MIRHLKILALTVLTFFGAVAVHAQEYPDRDIRFVVAYPAGGVSDLVGRVVAEGLSKQFNGSTVYVENKEGGTGIIGMREVVDAAPDGYTLLVGGFGGQVIPYYVNPNFPFDPRKDVVPLSKLAELVNVMIVRKDMDVDSVEDFIAYAKQHPGELNFGSAGIGASNHLAAAMFMDMTGVKMVHVPYKGGAAALTDLRAGVIDVVFENIPIALGAIEAGEVKALAVTSTKRSATLPDLPTLAEKGIEGFDVASWIMIYAPAGIKDDLVTKLGDALAATVKTLAISGKLQKMGFEPVGSSATEAAAFYNHELDRWGKFFEKQNLGTEQ